MTENTNHDELKQLLSQKLISERLFTESNHEFLEVSGRGNILEDIKTLIKIKEYLKKQGTQSAQKELLTAIFSENPNKPTSSTNQNEPTEEQKNLTKLYTNIIINTITTGDSSQDEQPAQPEENKIPSNIHDAFETAYASVETKYIKDTEYRFPRGLHYTLLAAYILEELTIKKKHIELFEIQKLDLSIKAYIDALESARIEKEVQSLHSQPKDPEQEVNPAWLDLLQSFIIQTRFVCEFSRLDLSERMTKDTVNQLRNIRNRFSDEWRGRGIFASRELSKYQPSINTYTIKTIRWDARRVKENQSEPLVSQMITVARIFPDWCSSDGGKTDGVGVKEILNQFHDILYENNFLRDKNFKDWNESFRTEINNNVLRDVHILFENPISTKLNEHTKEPDTFTDSYFRTVSKYAKILPPSNNDQKQNPEQWGPLVRCAAFSQLALSCFDTLITAINNRLDNSNDNINTNGTNPATLGSELITDIFEKEIKERLNPSDSTEEKDTFYPNRDTSESENYGYKSIADLNKKLFANLTVLNNLIKNKNRDEVLLDSICHLVMGDTQLAFSLFTWAVSPRDPQKSSIHLDLSKALEEYRSSIYKEDPSIPDYPLRVMTSKFRIHRANILLSSIKAIEKNHSLSIKSNNSELKLNRKIDEAGARNIEILSFFAGVLGFIISGSQLAKNTIGVLASISTLLIMSSALLAVFAAFHHMISANKDDTKHNSRQTYPVFVAIFLAITGGIVGYYSTITENYLSMISADRSLTFEDHLKAIGDSLVKFGHIKGNDINREIASESK